MVKRSDKSLKDRWKRLGGQAKAVLEVLALVATIAALVGVWIAYKQLRQDSNGSTAQALASRSAQARLVSASVMPGPGGFPTEMVKGKEVTEIALYNRSNTPVYHVVVSLVMVQGGGAHDGLELSHEDWTDTGDPYQDYFVDIPPGRYEAVVNGEWGGMSARPGVEIGFTDDNGRSWIRTADGILHPIRQPAADYYGLQEPLNWTEAPHTKY